MEEQAQQTEIQENPGEQKLEMTDDQRAVMALNMLLPKFFSALEMCSGKQRHRVIKELVMDGLRKEDEKPYLPYKQEQEAYYYGTNIFNCKYQLGYSARLEMEAKSKQENVNENV